MTSPGFVPDSSEVVGEEGVNRRGMPIRLRKRNSFYFDDENVVTPTSKDDMRKSLTKKPGRKATKESIDEISTSKNVNLDSSPPFGRKEVQVQPRRYGSSRGSTSSQRINEEHDLRSKTTTTEEKRNKTQSNSQVAVRKERGSSAEKPWRFTIHKNMDEPESSEPKRFVCENMHPVKTESPVDTACRKRKPRKKSKKASRDVSIPRTVRRVGRPKGDSISERDRSEPAGGLQKSKTCQYEDIGWRKELGLGFNKSPVINIKNDQDTTSRFCTDFETGGSVSDQELQEYNEMMDYGRKKADKSQKKQKHENKKVNNQERNDRRHQHKESVPVVSALPHVSVTPFGLVSTPSARESEILRTITMDRRMAHDIGVRLRNVLKLPKAHKWVCFEWFYSSVDKVLLDGPNDFEICLQDSFPHLKARKLTRVQWCKIRKYLGKPRRCSQKFLNEERLELAAKRQKVRMIQQRKAIDFHDKELPNIIPLQLVVGTKVTARLRKPQDGLFTGTIEGVDTSNNTYRITFERGGLGTHSIPDYEVLSNDPVETMSTTSYAWKIGYKSSNKRKSSTLKHLKDFPNVVPNSSFPFDGMLGGFSVRLLELILRLSKILKIKRGKIYELKELNVEAEIVQSYSMKISQDFRLKYSRCVLDLEGINKELMLYMDGILNYLPEIGPNSSVQMIIPSDVQMLCKEEANSIVSSHNNLHYGKSVRNPQTLALISSLASLMLQIKMLSVSDRNRYEVKCIKDTVAEIKGSLAGNNVQAFQERIEIPINRIHAGLCIPRPPKK